MPYLAVSVSLHGQLVEEQLLPVDRHVWIGAHPAARVAFPGGALRIRRTPEGLSVGAKRLAIGQVYRLRRGPVELRLQAVKPQPMGVPVDHLPDVRLLVLTAAAVLFGAWVDTVADFVTHDPVVAAWRDGGGSTYAQVPGELRIIHPEPESDFVVPCYPGEAPGADGPRVSFLPEE